MCAPLANLVLESADVRTTGTNGRWREVLTDAELGEFERCSAELLPADAAKWLNRG